MGVQVPTRRLTVSRRAAPAIRSLAARLRPHRALLVVLGVGAALRVLALVAIYPGIWFTDSRIYVKVAATGTLAPFRPSGYSLFVAPFWHLGSAALLIVVQHLIGLAIVVVLYALLLRRGAPRLVAVLAVVPVALDPYLVDIEHMVMAETVFHAAVVGALALLLWWERPGIGVAAASGLLLGYAAVTRSAAVPFIVLFAVYLIVRRIGWRRVVAFVAAAAVVLGGYAAVFKAQHGQFALTTYGARFLYSKAATFADCGRLGGLPADERPLCPSTKHRMVANRYLWSRRSPIARVPTSDNARVRDFAIRVIEDRPFTYARIVMSDVLHYFEPGHRVASGESDVGVWEFPADPRHWHLPGYRGPIRAWSPHHKRASDPNHYVTAFAGRPHLNPGASRFLHLYQRYAYTSGQVLALCVVLVAVALVLRRGAWRLRLDALLLAALTLTALVVSAALTQFSYRYGLIAVVLLPPAAGLATAALLRARPATGLR
jgi:hypothetical protein